MPRRDLGLVKRMHPPPGGPGLKRQPGLQGVGPPARKNHAMSSPSL
eukprot:CAMPEP_0206320908 /NCGR_PEP_ID=MMETSP0106_2-20121207/18588_1 /ASSEMBLY_ACC=CAM_ASM_000206 /TAXON_ID=81532 /ORGANISM="Acanthoeca-like sp., Strain 10tr" /LENGTH=45 /DNA_ID= /DNA_START= /DNA_END= /DNA_ORIENTATION=